MKSPIKPEVCNVSQRQPMRSEDWVTAVGNAEKFGNMHQKLAKIGRLLYFEITSFVRIRLYLMFDRVFGTALII